MQSHNPVNPPPLSHTRHGRQSSPIDLRWFVLGLLFVVLLIAGLAYWAASSSPSAEIEYEFLEMEVRRGTVTDLNVSGNGVDGRFTAIRQAYDGRVPVPEGYSESDAKPVTAFTATIPEGERERFIELAEVSNVAIELD